MKMKSRIFLLLLLLCGFLFCAPAPAHAQLKVMASAHSTTLSWTQGAPATCGVTPTIAYNVFRGTAPGAESSTPLNATPVSTTNYVDATVVMGTTYYYNVVEVETCGTFAPLLSGPSNEVSAIFPGNPSPPAMQNPVLV